MDDQSARQTAPRHGNTNRGSVGDSHDTTNNASLLLLHPTTPSNRMPSRTDQEGTFFHCAQRLWGHGNSTGLTGAVLGIRRRHNSNGGVTLWHPATHQTSHAAMATVLNVWAAAAFFASINSARDKPAAHARTAATNAHTEVQLRPAVQTAQALPPAVHVLMVGSTSWRRSDFGFWASAASNIFLHVFCGTRGEVGTTQYTVCQVTSCTGSSGRDRPCGSVRHENGPLPQP